MEKRNVPKLRFKEFSDEWEEYTLGSFLSFYTTNSFSRDCLNMEFGEVMNIHYGDIHMKFPTILNVKNNRIPFINNDVDISKINDECYCRNGDLIVADASEDYDDIGKSIELQNIEDKKIVSGLHTILARDTKGVTASKFKGYMMLNSAVRKQIKILAAGAKVLGISKSNLEKVSVKLPSLEEQTKIANFLSNVDKIIEEQEGKVKDLELYKKGMMQKIFKQEIRFKDDNGQDYPEWEEKKLSEVLTETKAKNTGDLKVCSVAVKKGVIDQIEHLGRSFAAKDTSNYKLVKKGDLIYTKSPTGKFPYGIVKQSFLDEDVIVSPLYGVFEPMNYFLGYILHSYFYYKENTNNYLHSIVQKGAKNTINISNETFLSKKIRLPINLEEQTKIANFLSNIDKILEEENKKLEDLRQWKKGLLQQMFV